MPTGRDRRLKIICLGNPKLRFDRFGPAVGDRLTTGIRNRLFPHPGIEVRGTTKSPLIELEEILKAFDWGIQNPKLVLVDAVTEERTMWKEDPFLVADRELQDIRWEVMPEVLMHELEKHIWRTIFLHIPPMRMGDVNIALHADAAAKTILAWERETRADAQMAD